MVLGWRVNEVISGGGGTRVSSLSWRTRVARNSLSFMRRSSIKLGTALQSSVPSSGWPAKLFRVFCTSSTPVASFLMRSLVPSSPAEVGSSGGGNIGGVCILCCGNLGIKHLSGSWYPLFVGVCSCSALAPRFSYGVWGTNDRNSFFL